MTSSDIIERRIILYVTLNLSYFQNNTIGLNRAYGRLSNRKTMKRLIGSPYLFGLEQPKQRKTK